MSEHVNADTPDEQMTSGSGLFISAEPLAGGGRLSATGDDSSDASDASGDADAGETDTLGGETDASDADSTDMGGDATESESGLGGENPLGINRERAGSDADSSDS